MHLSPAHCHAAIAARDARFDGVFFTGVITTGVYCRPVCPSRTPAPRNCRFFSSPAAAERDGFRPCLRCRPELAPPQSPIDHPQRVAAWAVQHIRDGAITPHTSLDTLAQQTGHSPRHFRRLITQSLGVAPMQLVQTTRLLIAKHLLTDSHLPISDIAHASGFGSARRLQAAFKRRYNLSPSQLRARAATASPTTPFAFTLEYREPLAWPPLLAFLSGRAIPGVELVDGLTYARTWRASPRAQPGWFRATPVPGTGRIHVEASELLVPHTASLIASIRRLFDLDASPHVISQTLGPDPLLSPSVRAHPGLRVPGCVDGFELAWRAVLGQQISVAAARTLAGRFASALGESFSTPIPGLTHLTPAPAAILRAGCDALGRLGLTSARAACLHELARLADQHALPLSPVPDPSAAITTLRRCPGIGDWTAHYIAMRALRWPDAFPAGDLILRRTLAVAGASTPKAALAHAQRWRPWRAYAAMHAWNLLSLDPKRARSASEGLTDIQTPDRPSPSPRARPPRTPHKAHA